jgi:hypothetical protein
MRTPLFPDFYRGQRFKSEKSGDNSGRKSNIHRSYAESYSKFSKFELYIAHPYIASSCPLSKRLNIPPFSEASPL